MSATPQTTQNADLRCSASSDTLHGNRVITTFQTESFTASANARAWSGEWRPILMAHAMGLIAEADWEADSANKMKVKRNIFPTTN